MDEDKRKKFAQQYGASASMIAQRFDDPDEDDDDDEDGDTE